MVIDIYIYIYIYIYVRIEMPIVPTDRRDVCGRNVEEKNTCFFICIFIGLLLFSVLLSVYVFLLYIYKLFRYVPLDVLGLGSVASQKSTFKQSFSH